MSLSRIRFFRRTSLKQALLLFAAAALYFSGLAWRAEHAPLAMRVEHFYLASDHAQSLFAYFKDTFQLPEVWPYFERGTFASGGLSLGNAVLEFVSFRRIPKASYEQRFLFGTEPSYLSGKIWVKKKDFSILKIIWYPKVIKDYENIEKLSNLTYS